MPPTRIRDELVYLDVGKLARLRVNAGLSESALKQELDGWERKACGGAAQIREGVSRNTVDRVFHDKGVRPDIAKAIADYFDMTVLDLVAPHDPRYVPPVEMARGGLWEWELDGVLQPGGHRAANGLHIFLCRLKHREISGRMGRGKYYLLSGMTAIERERKHAALRRHAQVCHLVGHHPQIAENESLSCTAGEEGWWVVDRWLSGKSLTEHLAAGSWPAKALPRLMREIAQGLSLLHKAGIVMRELAPEHIVITDEGQSVLSDFELAKLLDGAPTVAPSGTWTDNPYRAPEVASGNVTAAADAYSWARVLVHASSGHLPERGTESAALLQAGLPKAVWGVARDCLTLAAESRPQTMDAVQRAIQRWV